MHLCSEMTKSTANCRQDCVYSKGLTVSGVRATRSLVLCACFVDRCLSFCTFSFAIVLSVLRFTDFDYLFGILSVLLRYTDSDYPFGIFLKVTAHIEFK
jgi:hypothetical protein